MKHRCGFYIGDFFFSVPLESVREVLKKAVVAPVPGTPPTVAGLLNLRGAIVTVLDIRSRLGLAPKPSAEPGALLLLDDGDESVGLSIDRVGDVVGVEEGSFEPLPETLRGPARSLIQGAYKLPDRLMLALDLDAVLDAERSMAEGSGK
ncbi:MAG: chemotaxis protein CheW [Elusimicrobia bacterium]|nr:chemotaxis protein CheW [Elusimicrobiota bacterium]MBP8004673.1 chemotaxis protein CheW [Elusimicrobiota bacterium]